MFSKARSGVLAMRVAGVLGGTVQPCRASFGLLTMARHLVKTTYAGMRLEAYVFDPWLEAWVQDFRLRARGDVAFAVSEPQRVMALIERISDLATTDLVVFRRPWDTALEPVRAFFANPDNERDLRDLRLGRGESLAVLSQEMIVRLKATDDAQLRARFDVLGALCERNARPARKPALSLEPLEVTLGESGAEPATPHWFGGAIDGSPKCRNCRQPLHQLLSLDTQAPPLDHSLKALPRLPVAACLNCQVLSSPLVLQHGQGGWIIREQASSQSFHDFPAALPARPVRLEAPAGPAAGVIHRVGGVPEWIQSDETPDCLECADPMTFLAQLETDDRAGIQFGDAGRLYAFVCPRCIALATLIQSS